MNSKGIALLEKDSGRDVLRRACRKARVPISVIEALVEAELDQIGKMRKRGLNDRFDEILSELDDDQQEGDA